MCACFFIVCYVDTCSSSYYFQIFPTTLQQGGAAVQPSSKGQSKRSKAEEKALDTTTATWGGSTLPSEVEEGEKSPRSGSSVSLPSEILADITQDSILPNASALAGMSISCVHAHAHAHVHVHVHVHVTGM